MIYPEYFSPNPYNSSAIKTPENTEANPDDCELAAKGVTQME